MTPKIPKKKTHTKKKHILKKKTKKNIHFEFHRNEQKKMGNKKKKRVIHQLNRINSSGHPSRTQVVKDFDWIVQALNRNIEA